LYQIERVTLNSLLFLFPDRTIETRTILLTTVHNNVKIYFPVHTTKKYTSAISVYIEIICSMVLSIT
jgi:hypothetical protein